MTGFGRAQTEINNSELSIEIKTLNSKFADVSIKLPSVFGDIELEVKKRVTEKLVRGKISVSIELPGMESNQGVYNHEVITATYNDLKKLASSLGESSDRLLEIAIQSPGALETSSPKYSEVEYTKLMEGLDTALDKCDGFRIAEGDELSSKLSGYVNKIDDLLKQISVFEPERTSRVEEKLKANLAELESTQNIEVDQNRFEQELIYYIEKYDISEEKVRLQQHLNYFIEVMASEDAAGKKLGFISQEMGREINTLGSKANHADIQKLVVEMKEELEKIKEQVLNVL